MAQNDFTEDKATLFGAGMVTVGHYCPVKAGKSVFEIVET